MRNFVRVGTGLIYAAIVAAWAAYLVPLWLRRQDEEAAGAPSVESSPTPARVLERRQASRRSASGGPVDLPSPRSPVALSAGPASSARRGRVPSRPGPAVYRRRTLLALVTLTVTAAALGAAGVTPWWIAGVSTGAVLAFLVLSVLVGHVDRTRRRGTRPAPRPAARAADRVAGVPAGAARATARGRGTTLAPPAADGSRGAGAGAVPPPAAAGPATRMSTTPQQGGPHHADPAAHVARAEPEEEAPTAPGQWDPVQVPLPTYLTKAKATRTVRTVDLGEPGTWTSGRLPESDLLYRPDDSPKMLLDAAEPAVDEPVDEGRDDTDGDDSRRAVGD